MKRIQRAAQLLCAIAVSIGFLQPGLFFVVLAETEGGFTYTVTNDQAVITGYTGSDPGVVIPDRLGGYEVAVIGEEAFSGYSAITSVSMPDTVTEIQDKAFNECTKLSDVDFSDGLKTIGKEAFCQCVRLESLSFPSQLETIGTGAFFLCSGLKEVTIPASVKELGDYAFAAVLIDNAEFIGINASTLETVTFEEGSQLSKIGAQCFQHDQKLKSVNLPASLKVIGERAFEGCRELGALSFPEGLETVEARAFFDCSEIPELNITARTIGDQAFSHCGGAKSIAIPNAVKTGVNIFEDAGCPDESGQFPAFVIPASLTEVEEGSFSSMRYSSVSVEEGNPVITADGICVYNGSTLLAFGGYTGTSEYAVKEGTTRIGAHAFTNDYGSFSSVTLPPTVTSIGDRAFFHAFGSASETPIVIPDSVTTLGKEVFAESHDLETIVLGAGITSLPEGTFRATNLKSAEFRGALTTVGEHCFSGINASAVIRFPDSLTSIHPAAFYEWDAVESFGQNFRTDASGHYLLSEDGTVLCAYLRHAHEEPSGQFVLPEGITEIRDGALMNRNVTEGSVVNVVIPDTVTTIGAGALDCSTAIEERLFSSSDEVLRYANENGLACFSGDPELSFTEVTLASGETANLTLSNTRSDVYFFTSDRSIATVSDAGVITGVSKGGCQIFAATGGSFFRANVTVSDGEYPWDKSEGNTYLSLSDYISPEWEEAYQKRNPQASSVIDNLATVIYSGSAYQPMFGLHYLDNYGDESYLKEYVYPNDQFGKAIGQFRIVNDNVDMEVNRGRNGDSNLVLYSGTDTIDLYTGSDSSLKALKESVGKTVKFGSMISTSLAHSVADNFRGSGRDSTVLEFYLPSNARAGLYIREISVNRQEYELLLSSGNRFEIFDAGIREATLVDPIDHEKKTTIERYMKLRYLAPGEAPSGTFDPYVTYSEEPGPEPTPTAEPTAEPTVEPTAEPTSEPKKEESSSKPTAAPSSASSGVVTCQDAGYPRGYYWDETKKACVAPIATPGVITQTSKPGTPNTAGGRTNPSGNTASGTSGNKTQESGTSSSGGSTPTPETEPTASPESPTPSPTAEPTMTPSETEESEPSATPAMPIDIVNSHGPMWFLGIAALMVAAGLGVYLLKNRALMPWIIGLDAIGSIILAVLDHSVVGWLLLVLNLAAVGLLALYRRAQPVEDTNDYAGEDADEDVCEEDEDDSESE